MKKFLSLLLMAFMAVSMVNAQIVFDKFKLKKNGYVPAVKSLEISFKHDKIDEQLKYVKVAWYAVNNVGDVVDGQVSGIDQTRTHVFLRGARMVGPIPTGKKRYSKFDTVIVTPLPVTAIPVSIEITHMDDSVVVIEIDRSNYAQYFPNVKWIDYREPDED